MNSCSGYCHMSLVAEEIMWLLWRLWDSGDFIRVWLLVPHNLDNFSNSPEQISCENKPVWENWKFIISDQKLSPKTPTKLKCAQACKCIFSNLLVAICLQRRYEKNFLIIFVRLPVQQCSMWRFHIFKATLNLKRKLRIVWNERVEENELLSCVIVFRQKLRSLQDQTQPPTKSICC